jgi:uncharacterized protein YjbI with pentapeptide repeats
MANGRHLAKLNEGVEAWNLWRKGNPYTMPDLHSAILRTADLRKVDLRWADLRYADLRSALLTRSDLTGADLRKACLDWANLIGTHLIGANLRGASLARANLVGTNLSGVDFLWANLSGADLRKSRNLSIKQIAKAATLDGVELDLDYRKKLKIPGLRSRFIRRDSKKNDTRQCLHCKEEVQQK